MTVEPTGQPSGTPPERREITLAKWSTRFWAWLIDAIIVGVGLGVIYGILSIPMWLYGFSNPQMMSPMYGGSWWSGSGPFSFAVNSLVFFAYWTYFESTSGQSIGKRLLKIKTTDLAGNKADAKSVAISAFGKAFLLPLDVLLGWIFTNNMRQRLLARAANTIVIKLENGVQNIEYKKE